MTPARLAEIRAYIARLDLDQLPGWTVEQRIIADLWEALPEAWDEGETAGERHERNHQTATLAAAAGFRPVWPKAPANPYRDGEQQ